MPPMSSPSSSTSPVCSPARTWRAVLGQLGPDGVGGADRPGRAVEGGQEPVPGRPDLPAAEAGHWSTDITSADHAADVLG
jgi:hypothetical protein